MVSNHFPLELPHQVTTTVHLFNIERNLTAAAAMVAGHSRDYGRAAFVRIGHVTGRMARGRCTAFRAIFHLLHLSFERNSTPHYCTQPPAGPVQYRVPGQFAPGRPGTAGSVRAVAVPALPFRRIKNASMMRLHPQCPKATSRHPARLWALCASHRPFPEEIGRQHDPPPSPRTAPPRLRSMSRALF